MDKIFGSCGKVKMIINKFSEDRYDIAKQIQFIFLNATLDNAALCILICNDTILKDLLSSSHHMKIEIGNNELGRYIVHFCMCFTNHAKELSSCQEKLLNKIPICQHLNIFPFFQVIQVWYLSNCCHYITNYSIYHQHSQINIPLYALFMVNGKMPPGL